MRTLPSARHADRRWLLLVLFIVAGCGEELVDPVEPPPLPDGRVEQPPLPDARVGQPPPPGIVPEPTPALPTFLPAPPRLVALGDVHGDLEAARTVLIASEIVDRAGRWIAGDTVVVQVGDQLDRGNDERVILDWFETLRQEATAAGGAFIPLIGNHEVMNVVGNLNYVTLAGFADFADIPGQPPAGRIPVLPEQRGREVAFAPGGPYARVLAEHNVFTVVGDTVFVHGGLSPAHVDYGLERLNSETRAWMRGQAPMPVSLYDAAGPLWIRTYGYEPTPAACDTLAQALAAVPARRLVVAHTVQDGVNPACGGLVWRVDVGLSAFYGGPAQALEITGDVARVLAGP